MSQTKDALDYILASIQFLSLIFLIIYVIKTRQIASATKDAAEATKKSTELSQEIISEMGSFQIPVDSFSESLAVIGWQSQPCIATMHDHPPPPEAVRCSVSDATM